MKRIRNVTICLFLLFASDANGQQIKSEGYLINGTIKGIDSGIVRMLSHNGDSVLDSSIIINGKFSMQGKIGTPERMLFSISPGNWSFMAFVEDTIITLFIDTARAKHYGKGANKWALIWTIKETGSNLANVYANYERETNQNYYKSLIFSLSEKLKAIKNNLFEQSNLKHKIDSVTNQILSQQKLWIENYIDQYPSSVAGVYLFYEHYQSLSDGSFFYLDSVLNKFSGFARSSVYYKELTDIAINLKNSQVNSFAPDFTLLKRDKSKFSLSSTRGNYRLIDFWASWCVPCRKAIPAWKEVYAKYKCKGLTIVSVSGDRDWDDWIEALDKEQMPWVQLIDEFPSKNEQAFVAELFGVKQLPFYILIDNEGKVIHTSDSEDEMRKRIEEIFR